MLDSEFTEFATEWVLKFVTCYKSVKSLDEIENENVFSLDLNDRNIYNIENFNIFQSFPNLKHIALKGHSFSEKVENMNKFI